MSNAYEKFDLAGRTAVVTGGGTGLGYHITRGLIRSGAKVMIAARREDVLVEAAKTLNEECWPGEVTYHSLDLSDSQSINAFSEQAVEILGGVDIFVGNAAQEGFEYLDEITEERMMQMFQLNIAANMALTRNFLPGMRKKKWGRVIFSSSTASVTASAQQGYSAYSACKGALNAFARTAAAETGHDGITVNTLVLGLYLTRMVQDNLDLMDQAQPGAAKAVVDNFSSMTACGRVGRVDEIEGVIQMLASDAGSYVTGTNLCIDGGASIMMRPNSLPEHPVFPPA